MTGPITYVHLIEGGKIKEAWVDWDSLYDIVTAQLGMELKPKEEK
jgi:hypothetical protein